MALFPLGVGRAYLRSVIDQWKLMTARFASTDGVTF
jgi:hypothetical protein